MKIHIPAFLVVESPKHTLPAIMRQLFHDTKTKEIDIKRKKSVGAKTFSMLNRVCHFVSENRIAPGKFLRIAQAGVSTG
jgi:hypothetical protein